MEDDDLSRFIINDMYLNIIGDTYFQVLMVFVGQIEPKRGYNDEYEHVNIM